MALAPWHETSEFEHFVQFCETDEFLIKEVSNFVSSGLISGDVCIILATQSHRDGIEEQLKAEGLDLAVARASGKYVALDAASTLSQIMVDGAVDPASFSRVIGGLIQQAVSSGHSVRAFGELVALLWAEGNRAGAIRLEALWNDLSRLYSFALFCAYPMAGFDDEVYGAEFAEICKLHSRSMPGESYSTLTDPDERLLAITLLQQKSNSLDAEIAKRKQVEAALEESEARFREAFINMASHELKTPVTSLKGFVHILQNRLKKRDDEESLHFLASINKQLNKLNTLINELLDITRIEQGELPYQEELIDLDALVRETVENLQAGISTHELLFEGGIAAQVCGDKDRIGQALTNLIMNAVKYSPATGSVIIRLAKGAENVVVSVQDFGIGIAAKHQGRIFERFYQVTDPAEKTYPGLGIGLHLSSEIIKRHRGHMRVESEKGAGSTFSFSLPLA
jgi:signal transduction histidine kinase